MLKQVHLLKIMANSSLFFKGLVFFAIVLTAFSFFFVYQSFSSLITKISGHVITGEANVTVETVALVNFTTSGINWGSGRVNVGADAASLNTFATNNVTGGNWTLQTAGGLRLQNQGNVNVTLNLSGTKTAAQFIGGTSPVYKWNISNVESNSCLNSSGGTGSLALALFYDVNTTASAQFCGRFQYIDTADTIRIDFNLTIPSDSLTGTLNDVVTAVATAT